jgi:hypothetical protein
VLFVACHSSFVVHCLSFSFVVCCWLLVIHHLGKLSKLFSGCLCMIAHELLILLANQVLDWHQHEGDESVCGVTSIWLCESVRREGEKERGEKERREGGRGRERSERGRGERERGRGRGREGGRGRGGEGERERERGGERGERERN